MLGDIELSYMERVEIKKQHQGSVISSIIRKHDRDAFIQASNNGKPPALDKKLYLLTNYDDSSTKKSITYRWVIINENETITLLDDTAYIQEFSDDNPLYCKIIKSAPKLENITDAQQAKGGSRRKSTKTTISRTKRRHVKSKSKRRH
jgi:hypothetical protein